MKYSYRKYAQGDDQNINELYFQVTKRRRTKEQFAWQWLQTPGGESEIWLIEAHLPDGSTQLIGHHGLMALPFSHKGEVFRAGKTENTMVLPEYRRKILYPRYERFFLNEYEPRFQALFSTMGPQDAIRVRKAMGYKTTYTWHTFYWGHEPLLSLGRAFWAIKKQLLEQNVSIEDLEFPETLHLENTKIDAYRGQPTSDFDFDTFWRHASLRYPCTPERTSNYLAWRFWHNPYHHYITLILDDVSLGVAVCVLNLSQQGRIIIEDIFADMPEHLAQFIGKVKAWTSKVFRFFILQFTTTSDTVSLFQSNQWIEKLWLHELIAWFKSPQKTPRLMPRKITPSGQYLSLSPEDTWYITPIIFEGVR